MKTYESSLRTKTDVARLTSIDEHDSKKTNVVIPAAKMFVAAKVPTKAES